MNKTNTTDKQEKDSLIKSATNAAVFVGAILVCSKIIAWYFTNSLSIKASLVDSILDMIASTINFIAVRHALKPADKEHKFGHGKLEALAGLGQSIIILLSAAWLVYDAALRLINPEKAEFNVTSIIIMIASTFITACLVYFQDKVVKQTGSLAIKADAAHYKSDVLTNIAVITSFSMSSWFDFPYIDIIAGTAIAVFIGFTSWDIMKNAFDVLMDRELPDEEILKIKHIVSRNPKVLDMHDLRTRSSGHSKFIQMHLDMDGEINLKQAHDIAEEVERIIHQAFPNAEIIIHQDPIDYCISSKLRKEQERIWDRV